MTSMIKLAGATWSWVGATLEESTAIYRALGVNAVDLIAIPGKPLDTYQIAEQPKKYIEAMRNLHTDLSNLLVLFGIDFQDRALNSADPAVRKQNFQTFQRLLEFCVTTSCYSITVLPGVEQKGHSHSTSLEWARAELHRMNELAKSADVLLVYEPHVDSILEDPDDAVRFAENNSEIKLVIDYSHAVSMGHATNKLHGLVPYAGHVHLRQAAPGKIQARWEEGVINFPALVQSLQKVGYRGYATLEYEHDKFWEMDQCDVMTETIKMRDAVLSHLS